jgi:hypothetical protein
MSPIDSCTVAKGYDQGSAKGYSMRDDVQSCLVLL